MQVLPRHTNLFFGRKKEPDEVIEGRFSVGDDFVGDSGALWLITSTGDSEAVRICGAGGKGLSVFPPSRFKTEESILELWTTRSGRWLIIESNSRCVRVDSPGRFRWLLGTLLKANPDFPVIFSRRELNGRSIRPSEPLVRDPSLSSDELCASS
jgi:hypothetical protein